MRFLFTFRSKRGFKQVCVAATRSFSTQRVEVAVMALGLAEWKVDVEGFQSESNI